jgi:DNA-binding transcriptional LysR family regulator
MDVTVTGLRVVVEVARAGSFSAASQRLGYTQSAVSRQVAASEAATGAALFVRGARGVTMTPEGQVLLRHATRVLDNLAAAEQELAGLRDRLAGTLVVGGFPTATASLLPRAVARLLADHPGLEVRLLEASTPQQLQALRRGRLEVAVLATGEGLPDYDLKDLRLNELRSGIGPGVAVPEDHPYAGRKAVTPADLAGQSWVVGAGDGPEFGTWPGVADARIAYAVHDWPTRLGLVAAGLGIALVPGFAAAAVPSGVHWVPVNDAGPGLGRQMWAVTAEQPGEAATAMVSALGDVLTSLRPA